MNGRLLLDTNAVIAIFAGDTEITDVLTTAPAVFVPATVLGELYYGASKSANAKANATRIDEFAASSAILESDSTTARHYGDVKNALRAKGRLIPENDIWVAAVARQYELAVVSPDKHFQEVSDVRVVAW